MANENTIYDVIVLGGGISGLAATRKLCNSNANVLLLEARDRLGGRLCTVKDPHFKYTDVGGAYIGPTQHLLQKLIDDIGVDTYVVHDEGLGRYHTRGSWFSFEKNNIHTFNLFKLLDANHVMRTLDAMSEQVPCDAPWDAKHAKEWDEMTLRQFLDKTCYTRFSWDFVAIFLENVYAVEPHEISLLYFLWYNRSAQGLFRTGQFTDGAQERKFRGGAQTLCETLAETFPKSLHTIKFNSPVVALDQSEAESGDFVSVSTASGETFKARYVVSAMPAPLVQGVKISPALPSRRAQILHRMPCGSVIKTIVFFKEAYWRQKGWSGAVATRLGIQGFCADDCRPEMDAPALVGFIAADRCREFVDLTPEERKKKLCEHYAASFGDKRLLEPVAYQEKNWCAEEFSRGCYVSIMTPGTLTQFGEVLREPHHRLHFAGTETANRWAGYIDGGIQAGYRSAREVLVRLKKMDKVSASWMAQADLEAIADREISHTFQPCPRHWFERWAPSPGRFIFFVGGASLAGLAAFVAKRFGADILAECSARCAQK